MRGAGAWVCEMLDAGMRCAAAGFVRAGGGADAPRGALVDRGAAPACFATEREGFAGAGLLRVVEG